MCSKYSGIKQVPMCSDTISKITSSESINNMEFQAYDLSAKHKKNIIINAFVDNYGGYSEHGRQIVLGLSTLGKYNIKLNPYKMPVDIDPILRNELNQYVYNDSVSGKNLLNLIIATPGYMQNKFINKANLNVGWTMTETLSYPKFCNEWLQNVDYLLCPTNVDVERAKMAGVQNPIKVRLGYDENLYNEKVKPIDIYGLKNRYVYGFVGSWNKRKSVEEIIVAYCKSFNKNDKVTLLMVSKYGTRPYGEEKDNEDRWNIKFEFNDIIERNNINKDNMPHIAIIDQPIHPNIMPNIYAKFDCLVGFSKGESTWLPGLCAMGMGIPVIQLESRCSGFSEYINVHNSYLCKDVKYKYAGVELVEGGSEYYEEQQFAFGDIDELSLNMKRVYLEYGDVKQKNKIKTAFEKVSKFTWKDSVCSLDKSLTQITI